MPEHDDDPALDDLDTGLRDRLRYAHAGGSDLTRAELLELAEAMARQRHEIAGSLADLARRENEVTVMRDALEETSREAALELDERDGRLAALASELMLERARLEKRERELQVSEQQVEARSAAGHESDPRPGRLEALEGLVSELRERLDRVEAAVAVRVRSVPETVIGRFHGREDRVARALDVIEELARVLRSPLARLLSDDEAQTNEPVVPELLPAAAAEASDRLDEPDECVPLAAAVAERPVQMPALGHVVFVSTVAGYRLFERDGAAPGVGERVSIGELAGVESNGSEAAVVVTGLRASPLPGDSRPCVACAVVPSSSDGDSA